MMTKMMTTECEFYFNLSEISQNNNNVEETEKEFRVKCSYSGPYRGQENIQHQNTSAGDNDKNKVYRGYTTNFTPVGQS